ncbi:MAG: hypothetical protein JEZ09_06495 [Salinivirgaceae bacterium]|nr:hypothetical protein [Salinivirgaceae bacterium]
MGFNIITTYSGWWILLILVLSAVFSLFFYKKKYYTELSGLKRNILTLLRFLVLFSLGLLLLKPVFKLTNSVEKKPTIVVAVDNSSSVISGVDSLLRSQQIKANVQNIIKELSADYQIKTYQFGERISDSLSFDFSDSETNLEDFFNIFDTKLYNENIGAVIIASDGLYNKGQNPVFLAQKYKFPIYSIALGDTTINSDVFIADINYNSEAFLGNYFPVEVNVKANKLFGKKASVEIYHGNKQITQQWIDIDSDDFFKKIQFMLKADAAGLNSYSVRLSSDADDSNKLNNSEQFVVEIKKDKNKIALLYEGYHPDIGAINTIVSQNPAFDFFAYPISEFNENLKEYALVILYQLPSNSNSLTGIYSKIIDQEMPVWYIIGQKTSIRALNNLKTSIKIKQTKEMHFDAQGYLNPNFSLFSIDNENLSDFPPLNLPYGDYSEEPKSKVLFYQKVGGVNSNLPLWYFTDNGNQRQAFLLGEGIWRWRINEYLKTSSQLFVDELVMKTIQYLSVNKKSDQLIVDLPKVHQSGKQLIIKSKVYNDSYELSTKDDLFFEITDENGNVFPYVFEKTEDSYYLNTGIKQEGSYTYKANTNIGDKELTKTGKFIVMKSSLENNQMQANHNLLYKMSIQSNGNLYYEHEAQDSLISEIKTNENIVSLTYINKSFSDLLDIKLLFFILLSLLAIEWFLRKYWGLI